MASKESEEIKHLYRGWIAAMSENPDMGLDELRQLFDHWGDITAEPGEVDYIEQPIADFNAMWAIPKNCDQTQVALCTHGGGYVTGSMFTHRKVFAHVAKAVGCRALIVDYKRAPEYTHPSQVEDCLLAYKFLLDEGYTPEKIFFTGDSAGGALATSTMLKARDANLPLPACSVPMSPWFDPEGTGATIESNAAKDALVQKDVLISMAETFLGACASNDPYANLLKADLTGLSPMYIQVGGDETLLDDSIRFEVLAKKQGVDITLEIFDDMQHCFHLLAGRAAEADDAIKKIAKWVQTHLAN